MSRDLTCNESLADDGPGGFSPTQHRPFTAAPQQIQTSVNQSLSHIREQLLVQQQQLSGLGGGSPNFLQQPQRAASAMSNVEQLTSHLQSQQPQARQFYQGLDQRTLLQNNLVANLQYLQRQSTLESLPTASLATLLAQQSSNIYQQQLQQHLQNIGQNLNIQSNLARLQQSAAQLGISTETLAQLLHTQQPAQLPQQQQSQFDLTSEQRSLLLQHLQQGQNRQDSFAAPTTNAPSSTVGGLQRQQLSAQQLAELLQQNQTQNQVNQVLQRTQQVAQVANLQQYMRLTAAPYAVVVPQDQQKRKPDETTKVLDQQQPSTSHRLTPLNSTDQKQQDEQMREFERVKAALGVDDQQRLLDVLKQMQRQSTSNHGIQSPPSILLSNQAQLSNVVAASVLEQPLTAAATNNMKRPMTMEERIQEHLKKELQQRSEQQKQLFQQNQQQQHDSQSRPMVRHVPGEEIFESLPNKRLRPFEDQTAENAELSRPKPPEANEAVFSCSTPILPQTAVPTQIVGLTQPTATQLEQPRRRGRPRTNPLSPSKSSKPRKPKDSSTGGLFLKPTLNNGHGDTAVSPAGAKKKSIKRQKLPDEHVAVPKFTPKQHPPIRSGSSSASSSCSVTPLASPVFGQRNKTSQNGTAPVSFLDLSSPKSIRDRFPSLRKMEDSEIIGIKALTAIHATENLLSMRRDPTPVEPEPADLLGDEEPDLSDFVEGCLPGGLNSLEELRQECESIGKSPTALKILDTVFRNDDLFDMAKVQMYANYLAREKPSMKRKDLFKDEEEVRLEKNLKLMGMHTAEMEKKAEFVRRFIYEYTVLNLLNEEYELARRDAPREVFVEGHLQKRRLCNDFESQVPEVSKNLSCATLECKLMDQMYRYRAAFFQQTLRKPMAPRPGQNRNSSANLDQLLVMSMDVSATVYNMVQSVAHNQPYLTYEAETNVAVNHNYPTDVDVERIPFKTRCDEASRNGDSDGESRVETVIIKARDELDEEEELKKRLFSYLEQNTTELSHLTRAALKIRKRAIELEGSLLPQQKRLQRAHSAAPRTKWPETLPLYYRRRARSNDLGIKHVVNTTVGISFGKLPVDEEPNESDEEIESGIESEGLQQPSEASDQMSDCHKKWFPGSFTGLLDRFTTLIQERRRVIAALVKFSLKDGTELDVVRAAREPGVAADSREYQIFAVNSQRSMARNCLDNATKLRNLRVWKQLTQLSSGPSERGSKASTATAETPSGLRSREKRPKRKIQQEYLSHLYQNPESDLVRSPKVIKLSQLTQTEESNLIQEKKNRRMRAKERKIYKDACDVINGLEVSVPLEEAVLEKERANIDAVTTDRLFSLELLFRRLKCMALKVNALLDPETYRKFILKLEKIQAARPDELNQLRDDFVVGYLFEVPEFETVFEKKKPFNHHNGIKVLPNPEEVDFLFEDKELNPFRKSEFALPTSTPHQEVESAQLRKYRLRELDRTPAERLSEYMNLVLCGRALIRIIYSRPEFATELSMFTHHTAFDVLEKGHADDKGYPTTVYDVAVEKALQKRKKPLQERRTPKFDSKDDERKYFQKRSRLVREKFAALLTVDHKRVVLEKRCLRTAQRLTGELKRQEEVQELRRRDFNALSSRSKAQFLKRQRLQRFRQKTSFDKSVPKEKNLAAPLPVPGFETREDDAKPVDLRSTPFAKALRADVLQPPKSRLLEDPRLAKRGLVKAGRGRRGGRRGGKQ